MLAAAERPQGERDFAKCWNILRDGKPLEAAEAVASLAIAQDDAVAWLDGKLRPVQKPDGARVQKLLVQLDDDVPEKREAASRELLALGSQIEAEVKRILQQPPSAEVKRHLEEILQEMRSLWLHDLDSVRAVRSVYVLERIGSRRLALALRNSRTATRRLG